MNARNVDVVTQTFEAIEQRDRDRAFALYHPPC
jgi:ketosteroid isomerase-like protein